MAKITKMPSLKIIRGFKGTLDFYYHRGILCVRKWPDSPGKNRSPNVQAQWPVWTQAAKLWPQLSLAVRQAYTEMAVSTNLTDRDMFFRGYISGTLKYYKPVDELEGS